MSASRRQLLAAAMSLPFIDMAAPALASNSEDSVARLIKLSADSNAALMRGDLEGYLNLVGYSDDFTLMSPFGGTPTHGADLTPDRLAALGRFFKDGTFEQEVVQAYGSRDMVVLAVIERANVAVGGLPAQDWALRVTLVYRRDGGRWLLAHRHADPLVDGITLQAAAALAIGQQS